VKEWKLRQLTNMSYGLVFASLLTVCIFIGLVGGLVWWVRRPLSARRSSHDALPLFGHDRAVVYPRAQHDGDEDARARVIMERSARSTTPATPR